MIKYLAHGFFMSDNDSKLDKLTNSPDENEIGFFVENDLKYPKHKG